MSWENLEEAFKDLDAKEFEFFAAALGAFRQSLQKQGFTRREAMRLVETYSRFIYDMSLEDYIANKNRIDEDEEDDDVDGIDEDLL